VRVAPSVIAVISATAAALVALIVFGVIRSRRVGVILPIGVGVAPGALGQVRAPLAPLGSVIANGEEWSARTSDGSPLERGTPIRVVKVEGLTLTVEPDASSSKGT
jgi:membrane-bound ClpP family serine protease